jgi:hypothetical protein
MIHVSSEDLWPPPEDWVEVRLSWKWTMLHYTHQTNTIYRWVLDAPGGRFHLSGYGNSEGFSYRFERPEDATWFRLNLPK